MRVGRFVAAFVVCAAAVSAPAAPSGNPPWAAQVDRVFQQWDTRGSPGCAVGVFEGGRITYERGYGTADLEHDAPIAPASAFYVGSLSKQFTAFAAALAIQQGTLGYDDSIRKYLPEMPAYADAIKVSHLIHHTSGLRDYYALLAIAGRRWDEPWDNRAVLDIASRQKHLNLPPGTAYSYSNTGYTLLATVIERATKTPFAEFMDANVFKPLGMAGTLVHTDASRLIKGRALGYGGTAGKWTLDTPHNERSGAGGLYTNIPDLQRWDENFYSPRVSGPELIAEIQTRAHLVDGKEIDYAWGLEVGEYRGLRVVQHGGSLGGYRAHLMRFPDQHTSVAVLCNLGSIRPQDLADEVADAVLGSRLIGTTNGNHPASRPEPPVPYVGPIAAAAEYAGTYASDELDATFMLLDEHGSLALQREDDPHPLRLAPIDGQAYRGPGFVVHFRRAASGEVSGFTVSAGPIHDIEFGRRR